MSKSNERVYRPFEASDLPGIQSGKLKAFHNPGNTGTVYWPVRLITSNLSSAYSGDRNKLAWLVEGHPSGDYLLWYQGEIKIDITPEKRYAIWNKKKGRFARFHFEHVQNYPTREHAQDYINRNCSDSDALTVVEFDYPGEPTE